MTNFIQLIPQFSIQALLYEAVLQPKPGLVDPSDAGAHNDMDIYTFLDSITALTPFFTNYYQIGYQHQGSYKELFEKLRVEGILAEKAMFSTTRGINTHKGANFSFAVIIGATGYYIQQEKITTINELSEQSTKNILKLVQQMTTHLISHDLEKITPTQTLTHGEKLYLTKGRTGIRGEAADGYPALENLLLPFLRGNKNIETELLLLQGLLLLMSEIEDANILHRGGEKAWEKVKKESTMIFLKKENREEFIEEIIKYNKTLKKRHLSPGGAADLLALGIYFAFLEKII